MDKSIKKYYLKQKDNVVASVDLVKVLEFLEEEEFFENEVILNKDMLPFGFESMEKFIISRKPPKNRAFVDSLMLSLDVDHSLSSHIDVTLGFSLNDTYWVVPEDLLNLKYDDYNLYENQFSETLSLVAFTGNTERVKGLNTSPEFTTQGMLRKCWSLSKDGDITLYKSGTDGASNLGNEPYSEYYISQIEERIGIPHVKYKLEKFHGILVSSSKCFCDNSLSYSPIFNFLDKKDFDLSRREFLEKCINIFSKEMYWKQFALDYITVNTDRHLNNYGLYYNPDSKEIISPAKIYDNGFGLFPQMSRYSAFKSEEELLRWSRKSRHASNFSFDILLDYYNNKTIKECARRLIGFEIEPHPKFNLPEWRIEMLNKLIQKRVYEILNSKKQVQVQGVDFNMGWE